MSDELRLTFRIRNERERFGINRWLKLTVSDLKRKGFDQGSLFTVIQAELAGGLIDKFELPGHQREAVLQGVQRLFVQVHVVLGVIQQTMNMQRKFRHCFQCEGIGPARQF